MDRRLIAHFPLPVMIIGQSGRVTGVSSELLTLLDLKSLDRDTLAGRFEILDGAGNSVPEEQLGWNRATRGEEFEARQVWHDRSSGRKHLLRVTAEACEGGTLLAFEDEARAGLAPEVVRDLGAVARSLFGVDDPRLVAHAVVELVMQAMKAGAAYLSSGSPGSRDLQLLAAVGLPSEYLKERASIPFDAGHLAAVAARTGQLQQVDHIERLPVDEYAATRRLLRIGMRSFVAIPLIADGETVGVLSLARKQPGRLLPIEAQILRAVAEAGALALRKARVRELEQASQRRLETVRDVILALEAGKPLKVLLRELVVKACEMTGARYGALGVLNPQKTGLSEFIPVGISEETMRRIGPYPSGRGLLGAVIQSRSTIRVRRLDQDPRSSGFPPHHPKMTTFLGAPLRIGTEVFGDFYFTEKAGGAEFTEDDARIIELFAAHAALAVGYASRLELVEEERRIAASHHRELERLRDEFAAIVAHDLRNPIQAIASHLELLLRQAKEGEETVAVPVAVLWQIRRSGFRLAQMASDLLDVARIEVDRIFLDRKDADPRELVSRTIEEIRPSLGDHPVEVSVDPAAPRISVDEIRVAQVLANLLENSAKYSAAGGAIRIRVGPLDQGCLISVEDRGPGISAADLPRLFDRFYQTRRARERRTGLGLGLYISKGLVDAHGGRIWAESVVGQGSVFHVWLPRDASARAIPKAA